MTRCLTLSLTVFAMMLFTTAARADVNDKVKECTSPKDSKEFAMKAAQGGMLEVQASQLAQQKASSNEIKDLAKRIEQDHKQANSQLMAIAQQKNINLPNDLQGEAKEDLEVFQKLNGKDFDNAYLLYLVKDHLKDIAMFQKEAQAGTDPDIKQWAAKNLPVLREHAGMTATVAQASGLPIDALSGGGQGARPAGAHIQGSSSDNTSGTNSSGSTPGTNSSGSTSGSGRTSGTNGSSTGNNNK
jgi:putative membrane protein